MLKSHTKLHARGDGNVTMNVMETDAVFWWATTFCTPSSLYDKMLQSVTDPVLDDEQLEESKFS